MEKNSNHKIKKISYVFFLASFVCIVVVLAIAGVGNKYLVDSKYDSRIKREFTKVKRGTIYDRNGNVLTFSKFGDDGYYRVSNYPTLFAHTIGYAHNKYGTTGIEARFNNILSGRSGSTPETKVNNVIFKEKSGDDIYLTLDLNLQQKAKKQLGNMYGSIVISDPNSGEILASVSNPSYNEIDLNENSFGENSKSVFLDRAVQGKYMPGSVMKIVAAINLIQNGDDKEVYNDNGSIKIDESVIKNAGGIRYGAIDLKTAFAHSVNTYFINENMKYIDEYKKLVNDINIALKDSADFNYYGMNVDLGDNNFNKALISICQGKSTASPMAINMLTTSIYNGGYFYSPTYIKKIQSPVGKISHSKTTKKIYMPFNETVANEVKDYMYEVVKTGTAKGFNLQNCGGKTGTAELGSGKYNFLFTGFYENEKNSRCVTIVLENCPNFGYNISVEIFKNLIN